MLQGFFILLACQLLGESLSRGVHVPIPGPVLGIVLLLLLLAVRGWQTGTDPARHDTPLGFAADGLLRNLGLLFVPAGVGIVQSFHLVLANGVAVIVALVGSTFITLIVTVFVFRVVSPRDLRKGRHMTAPAGLFHLWVYLAASPLLWLTVTIGVYLMAQQAAALSGNNPLVNPVLISIVTIVLLLLVTKTDYRVYFAGAQFVHFTLGPATVALGVPLYRNRALVRSAALPIIAALAVGTPTAMLSAVWIASALGAPMTLKLALIPKSVTAGIAMGIARQIGGDPTLTAVFVISTGIIGAIAVTPLMNLLGIRDYAARGFAAGLTSHGIGTARAFQVNDVAGAFAGLAMALNGLMTAVGAPLILALIRP